MDMLVGGGWQLIERFPQKSSASIVVRGGPGTGKTLLALQVALDLADALGGDVAIACVELLPTEYQAQVYSARTDLAERVAVLPEAPANPKKPSLYLGLLTDLDPAAPDLVAGLESLDRDTRSVSGNPVVFLVDSLIEGYGLGRSASRTAVDAVMKFGANGGYGIVLCEEAIDDVPSAWAFAADTVIEVGYDANGGGRSIAVRKHRFGASASGRHELDLQFPDRPAIFPKPDAWIAPYGRTVLSKHGWHFSSRAERSSLRIHPELTSPRDELDYVEGALVLVRGNEDGHARTLALGLIPAHSEGSRDLVISLDPLALRERDASTSAYAQVYIPTTFSAARALRILVSRFSLLFEGTQLGIRRVLVGDLDDLGSNDPDWERAIGVFASLVIDAGWGVPVVLYTNRYAYAMARYPDVVMNIESNGTYATVTATEQRGRGRKRVVELDFTLSRFEGSSELEQLERTFSEAG